MAINDFGEKIGGAKKDLWRQRNLLLEDLDDMNEAERANYIKKDLVWKKPDYQELVDSGIPVRVVYFMKKMRDAAPVKPVLKYYDDNPDAVTVKQEGYIAFVGDLRDAVMSLRTEQDVLGFYNDYLSKFIVRKPGSYYVDIIPEAYDCIDNKLLKAAQISGFSAYDREIAKKQFCYSADEKVKADEKAFSDEFRIFKYCPDTVTFGKSYNGRDQIAIKVPAGTYFVYPKDSAADPSSWENDKYFIIRHGELVINNMSSFEDANEFVHKLYEASRDFKDTKNKSAGKNKRKSTFVPKQLQHINRNGNNYRHGFNALGKKYLEDFGFRGGEFGNWMSENDRRSSLNYGYDALMDLCEALRIAPNDVSLGGRLAIAFGARGSGSALAHYEPMREVINLTKMKGAGSLAHEWAHAVDDILGKLLGLRTGPKSGSFMTDNVRDKRVPESLNKLVDTMMYKKVVDEGVIQKQKAEIERYTDYIKKHIRAFFSLSSFSEEQKFKLESLIDDFVDRAKDCKEEFYAAVMTGEGNKAVDALSNFRKETMGRVLPKDERIDLVHRQNTLRGKIEGVGDPVSSKTDFYSNSVIFDKMFSKTDNGYWQSKVEMFARAFACYVSDKLKELGVTSDYLCGHSECAVGFYSDPYTKELKLIQAIPVGDERKAINQCFDELICELKELGMLHEYVPEQELVSQRKSSLLEQIQTAEGQREIPVKESTSGQLSFDLDI